MSTLDDIKSRAVEKARDLRDKADQDARALGLETIDSSTNPSSVKAAEDISAASDGAISTDFYFQTRNPPDISRSPTALGQMVEDAQRQLLTEASQNLNAFTRQTLVSLRDRLKQFELILSDMNSEMAQISLMAASQLILPPLKDEVADVRDRTQTVKDLAAVVAQDLRASRSRRAAAAQAAGNIPAAHVDGTGRSIVATAAPDHYVTARQSALDLKIQEEARGMSGDRLERATKELTSTVLGKASYVALCATMASLSRNRSSLSRAQALYKKIDADVKKLLGSLDANFVAGLQMSVQESAAKMLEDTASLLQNKLDAVNNWLGLVVPPLPTFTSTLRELGSPLPKTPLSDAVANYCDLNMATFCSAQGLLEIASEIDAKLAEFNPRAPALGVVRLLCVPPDESDLPRPAVKRTPDRETEMFLCADVGPGANTIRARVARAQTEPGQVLEPPTLSGLVAQDTTSEWSVKITNLSQDNIATVGGTITIDTGPMQQVLRYASFDDDLVFSLIDPLPHPLAAGAQVLVKGEQRDTFQSAFAPSPNIHGGAGKLTLAGDGEASETLEYSGSTFDTVEGQHIFALTSPALAPTVHKFTVLGRPHPQAHELLYKTADMTKTARRFRVRGLEITCQDDPDFDFTQGGLVTINRAQDYDQGGEYRLCPGSTSCLGDNAMGLMLDSAMCRLTGLGTKLALYSPIGDLDNIPLSRVRKPTTTIFFRLDDRAKADLLVTNLAQGQTSTSVTGRMIIDCGQATSHVTDVSRSLTGDITQTLTSASEVVRGDETGLEIKVQSGPTTFTARVKEADTSTQTLTYDAPLLARVDVAGNKITSPDPLTVVVGDFVYIQDLGRRTVTKVIGPREIEVDGTPGTMTSKDLHIVADQGKTFSIHRLPQETLEFTAIKNIDNHVYEFVTPDVPRFRHGIQISSISPTLRIVPNEIKEYLSYFEDEQANVRPRFDGETTPPGSLVVKAELEQPSWAWVADPIIASATSVRIRGRTLPLDYTSKSGDLYRLRLTNNLPWALVRGEVLEIPTTSIFDMIPTVFGSQWAKPFDDFFAQVAEHLKTMGLKLCRILSGRPLDVAVNTAAVTALILSVRAANQLIIISLELMIAGLAPSDVLARIQLELSESGLDAAADLVASGDVEGIALLTPDQATGEGAARKAIEDYRNEIYTSTQVPILDRMIYALTAREYDKSLMVDVNRDYRELARSKIEGQQNAARALETEAETV